MEYSQLHQYRFTHFKNLLMTTTRTGLFNLIELKKVRDLGQTKIYFQSKFFKFIFQGSACLK